MASRRTLSKIITLTLGAITAAAVSGVANAAGTPPPSITMSSVYEHINVNQAPQFIYSTAYLSTYADLQLQRQFGTDNVWETVVDHVKHGTNLKVTAPKLPELGHYRYRMQAVRDGSVVARTKLTHSIFAYGTVKLKAMCNKIMDDGYCEDGYEEVGSTVFDFSTRTYSACCGSYENVMSLPKTSCRSITLHFASSEPSEDTTYVKLVQSASDPQYASTPPNTIGTLSASLDGGSWILSAQTTNGHEVYYAGSASCYSHDGTR